MIYLPFQIQDGVLQRVKFNFDKNQFSYAFLLWFVLFVPGPKRVLVPIPVWEKGFPIPKAIFRTPAVYHSIQLNSDTIWSYAEIPQVKGLLLETTFPHLLPPKHTLDASHKPRCYLYFWLTGHKSEVPKMPSLGLIHLLNKAGHRTF